jgi:mRNA interferase MazF
VRRGEIWWASLTEPQGSGPGFRRPVVVVQSNPFNESRIRTVIVAVITSNLRLSDAPGNVLLGTRESRLPRDSVINVSQILTIDKAFLTERVCILPAEIMGRIDAGLKLALDLGTSQRRDVRYAQS